MRIIYADSGEAIKGLQNSLDNIIAALKLHLINIVNWACTLTYLCSTRLPVLTLSLWEQSVKDKTEIPSWEDFDNFLTARNETLKSFSDFRSSVIDSHQNSSGSRAVKSHQTNVSIPSCKLCPRQQHTIRNCSKFLKIKFRTATWAVF